MVAERKYWAIEEAMRERETELHGVRARDGYPDFIFVLMF
jgi:hypothetical protein